MNIGILVNNLLHTQFNYFLSKRLIENTFKRVFDDITVFYCDITEQAFPYPASTMHISEAYLFNAPCIATDLLTAHKLLNIFGPTRKLFYSYNLEWIRPEQFRYDDMAHAYLNLEVIARNKDHSDIIENCWNKKPFIVKDLNLEELKGILGGQNV